MLINSHRVVSAPLITSTSSLKLWYGRKSLVIVRLGLACALSMAGSQAAVNMQIAVITASLEIIALVNIIIIFFVF